MGVITKDQLLDAIAHECMVCKHLFTKITREGMSYRPTPGQRSTEELLRYLTITGISSLDVAVHGGDWSRYPQYHQRQMSFPIANFPEEMDRQIEEIRGIFDGLTEDDLNNREAKHPGGEMMPLGYLILRMPLEWLVAYRMQLFLYAKAAGAHDINTANCWSGYDVESETESATEAEAEPA